MTRAPMPTCNKNSGKWKLRRKNQRRVWTRSSFLESTFGNQSWRMTVSGRGQTFSIPPRMSRSGVIVAGKERCQKGLQWCPPSDRPGRWPASGRRMPMRVFAFGSPPVRRRARSGRSRRTRWQGDVDYSYTINQELAPQEFTAQAPGSRITRHFVFSSSTAL